MDERPSRRTRVVQLVLAAISVVAVFGLGSVAVATQLASGDRVQQAQRHDRDALQGALSGLVQQYFTATFLATKTAADGVTWTGTAQDRAALQHLVQTSPLTSYGAALVSPTGVPLATYGVLPPMTDPGYVPMRETGLSDVMRAGGTSVVAFAVPTQQEQLLIAYADASRWNLQSYHQGLYLGEGAVPFVLDSQGVVAASGDASLIGTHADLPTPTTATVEDGRVVSAGDAGRGWRAVTVQDAKDWSAGTDATSHRALLALAALLTGVVALLVLFHHRQQVVVRRLAQQRLYDPLTGLAMRRLFEIRLEAAFARMRRSGAPVALLYCDLNDFKLINDVHGHNTGDHVLREVAARLKATVREDDFVVRLGGDEFAVLIEGAEPTDVRGLVTRLTEAVEQDAHGLVPRIAIGGAYTRSVADTAALVHAADLAMYTVKTTGETVLTDLDRPALPRQAVRA